MTLAKPVKAARGLKSDAFVLRQPLGEILSLSGGWKCKAYKPTGY